ncbi:uncharacterized protein Y057_14879 [Fusarium fujikuroi]|nr:uncharacterized protein Y057_14879 [Fusarium fujikuroi]
MSSRTSLRSILRGWFASDKYSDSESEPDVRIESARGECPLPDRNRGRHKRERKNPFGLPKKRTYCSHCHGTNGYGDNDFSRGEREAKRKKSHKDQHASGGQQHRLSEQLKPLPVAPRQRPPQARGQRRTPSEDTSLQREGHNQKHKRSNAVDTRPNASKQVNRKKHGIHTLYQQDQDQDQDQGSNEAIFLSDDRSMNREAVSEVVDMIAQRFSHIPYAVSGLAAMVYYGYEARPYRVSIVCPEHTRENQKCWAKAQGISLEPQGPGAMGVLAEEILKLIPGSDMEALVYPALYNEYVESQTEGVRTMTSVINNYVKNCPDTDLILMGYSQGAHVTMDTMCGASSDGFPGTLSQPAYITDNVVAIIAMGDPSLTEGQPFLVGTSEGSGIFPRNLPIGCDSIASKTVSICDKGDPYCEAGGKDLSVHLSYIKNYGEFTVGHVVKAWKARN